MNDGPSSSTCCFTIAMLVFGFDVINCHTTTYLFLEQLYLSTDLNFCTLSISVLVMMAELSMMLNIFSLAAGILRMAPQLVLTSNSTF